MKGRTASLLLCLCVPAILSATCNPKKTQPPGVEPGPVDAATAEPAGTAPEPVQACPGLSASAGPLGPAVGPACPGAAADADPELAGSLETLASVHAKGLAPLGPVREVEVVDGGALVRSAVLQGPPHCYVLLVSCTGDANVRLDMAPTGASAPSASAAGPFLRFCPPATGSFDVFASVEKPPATCAARIYGD